MVTATRSRPGRSRQCVLVQKPMGQLTPGVQAAGPEHFGRRTGNPSINSLQVGESRRAGIRERGEWP